MTIQSERFSYFPLSESELEGKTRGEIFEMAFMKIINYEHNIKPDITSGMVKKYINHIGEQALEAAIKTSDTDKNE
ncbi:MAG: hypothetical protein WCP20_11185 [Desulfuromonadales bacterium]